MVVELFLKLKMNNPKKEHQPTRTVQVLLEVVAIFSSTHAKFCSSRTSNIEHYFLPSFSYF